MNLKSCFFCEYRPDPKTQALDDRLAQYYKETESCDNKYAMERWKEFKRWAFCYTSQEINQAKRRVGSRMR